MRFHIPLHRARFFPRSSCDPNCIEAVPVSFDLKEIERVHCQR
ncbi:hypothetical protein [Microcoleus sp. K4-C2]